MNAMAPSSDKLRLARSLLAEALDLARESIDDEVEFDSMEAWDSLAHLRLVLAMEEHRGRQLEPEEVLSISTLHDIARLL